MPVNIKVTSDSWSDKGKIPEVRAHTHDFLKEIADKLVSADEATPETVKADLRKAVNDWSTKNVIDSIVIKNLAITCTSDAGDEWGTEEKPLELYAKKGIMYVAESSYGYGYGYHSYSRYGRGYDRAWADDDDDTLFPRSTPITTNTGTKRTPRTRWEEMSDEEFFETYYGDGRGLALM